jgi:hypothetical protein
MWKFIMHRRSMMIMMRCTHGLLWSITRGNKSLMTDWSCMAGRPAGHPCEISEATRGILWTFSTECNKWKSVWRPCLVDKRAHHGHWAIAHTQIKMCKYPYIQYYNH